MDMHKYHVLINLIGRHIKNLGIEKTNGIFVFMMASNNAFATRRVVPLDKELNNY